MNVKTLLKIVHVVKHTTTNAARRERLANGMVDLAAYMGQTVDTSEAETYADLAVYLADTPTSFDQFHHKLNNQKEE